ISTWAICCRFAECSRRNSGRSCPISLRRSARPIRLDRAAAPPSEPDRADQALRCSAERIRSRSLYFFLAFLPAQSSRKSPSSPDELAGAALVSSVFGFSTGFLATGLGGGGGGVKAGAIGNEGTTGGGGGTRPPCFLPGCGASTFGCTGAGGGC